MDVFYEADKLIINKKQIRDTIIAGGIIAYPTEAVYGLGCDPWNEKAVQRLAKVKGRSLDKGFLLIAASWQQIESLIAPIPQKSLDMVKVTWPGPVTWVFPCTDKVPKWIQGKHQSVAVRISAHPIAKQLCEAAGTPIVSTSANLSQQAPLKTAQQVSDCFGENVDYIIDGAVGDSSQVSAIRDAITGEYLRKP